MPHGDGSIARTRIVEAKITATGEVVLRGPLDEVMDALDGQARPEGGWTIGDARPRVCTVCRALAGLHHSEVAAVPVEQCEHAAHDHSLYPESEAEAWDRTIREVAIAKDHAGDENARAPECGCADEEDCAACIHNRARAEEIDETIDVLCGLGVRHV